MSKETPEVPEVSETLETAENELPVPEEAVTRVSSVDVVAMPSLRADGTPDQSDGYVCLIPDDDA